MAKLKKFASFEPWFQDHKRTAWKPVVEKKDGALTDSKMSGTPLLPDGQWPLCGSCQQPLQLFVQLNLAELPSAAPDFGSGLIQFFFCTNEDAGCYADGYGDPFADCQIVRRLDMPTNLPAKIQPPKGSFPARRIVDWSAIDDFPSCAERESLGLTYGNDNILRCAEIGVEQEMSIDDYFDGSYNHAFRGNKLAGWPTWVQNVEYATCRKCDALMNLLVFQIAHDKNIPFMLADGGIGQIIQCPEHKDELAFVWASG